MRIGILEGIELDVRVINYFISVYEEGSFTKAAERMHVVQSTLSMQIRTLEDEFDALMFERTSKGLIPTIAGRRLYELCVPIARDLALARQEIRDLTQGDSIAGTLRIGLTSAMCRNVLGAVIEQFYQRYPKIDLMMMEGYARDVTERVQDGSLDVGLGALPLEESSLSCRLGFTDDYVLVSGRPINGPSFTPCNLFEMMDLKLIIPSERHLLGATMKAHLASGRLKPRGLMKVDGTGATLEVIRDSDWGAICLMNSVSERIECPHTFIYPIQKPTLQFDLYLLHNLGSPLDLAARAFIDLFETQLREVQTLRRIVVPTP
ncbi:LysR family transcriptional regulator [Alcaligenaceae bacterium]|nr:LysR family transcriptional regulator [Alcaligenaceae bacterium]